MKHDSKYSAVAEYYDFEWLIDYSEILEEYSRGLFGAWQRACTTRFPHLLDKTPYRSHKSRKSP